MIFGTEVIPNGMTVLLSSVSIPTRLMIPMLEIQYLAWMGKSIIYIKREKEKDVNLMDRGKVRLSSSQTRKKNRRICGLLQSSARHAIDIRRPRLLFVYSLNYSSRPIVFIRELYVTILYIHILHTFVHSFIHIYIYKLENKKK